MTKDEFDKLPVYRQFQILKRFFKVARTNRKLQLTDFIKPLSYEEWAKKN